MTLAEALAAALAPEPDSTDHDAWQAWHDARMEAFTVAAALPEEEP